jgi:ribosomal protein L29
MNDIDLEILLYRILTGKTYFDFNDQEYYFISPSKEIRYKGLRIYNSIIQDEKYYNWIREENLVNTMIALGVWDANTDNVLQGLEKSLDKLKIELYKAFVFPSKQVGIRKNISNVRKNITKILTIKQEYMSHTLEGYANSLKTEYIICNTLYKDDRLVFNGNPKNTSASYTFFNSLVKEIDSLIIGTEKYKTLARSSIWRSYWNANKCNRMFNFGTEDTTDEQRALINISKMYDSIYEHPECPDDKIIEDDDMLDGWMLFQKEKRDKEKKQDSIIGGNNKMKNAGEIFLMAGSKQEVDEIYALNSDETKAQLQNKQSYIQKVGSANEVDLPDVQMELNQRIQQMNANSRRR